MFGCLIHLHQIVRLMMILLMIVTLVLPTPIILHHLRLIPMMITVAGELEQVEIIKHLAEDEANHLL